jgi:hypothetical protein
MVDFGHLAGANGNAQSSKLRDGNSRLPLVLGMVRTFAHPRWNAPARSAGADRMPWRLDSSCGSRVGVSLDARAAQSLTVSIRRF